MDTKIARFLVTGSAEGSLPGNFSLEVDAMSERHAASVALTKIGSRHGIRANGIRITGVKRL